MAEAAKRTKRARRWQRRIAVIVFSLFPMAVLAGLLSPDVISLQIATQLAEQDSAPPAAPIDLQSVSFKRAPLLVPRDFSAGFIPELLDLDQLFLDTAFRVDPSGERLARLLAFPRSHGDAIVLDDSDGTPLDMLFDDALVADTIPAIPDGQDDAFGLGPIGGSVPLGNRVRFDDFPNGGPGGSSGGGAAVPEPHTAMLIALGLGALGIRRRA